ncbi:MAG TPA: monofunctional biosynthetic peptidoglycan transglycosylase [Bacteroidia bacterium]|nr:monofunctional biosynthetic peptidoglycan transglycosylase [Bacteroidia bacterium]
MRNFLRLSLNYSLRAGIFFLFFSVVLVIVLRWLPVSYTPLMFFRCMQHAGNGNVRIEHQWVNADRIPNHLELAVVCTEDQRFLTHHGFDFEEIQKAMDEAEDGERQRGASTISQQTAKNVFLWPSSTFVRKGFEAWFTVLIELFWSKQRILEVYLNSAEFGDGIYGCESAAQHFFHKSAIQLSINESVRLAIVLPNPIKFNAGKPSPYLMKRQKWALEQMGNYGGVLKFPSEVSEEKITPKKTAGHSKKEST